jgi:hypothetical protein
MCSCLGTNLWVKNVCKGKEVRNPMLAPGELRNARGSRGRRDKGPTARDRMLGGQELTLTQAMSAGKWELLSWLEARAKAASQRR